jgi:hypothetical protein
MEAQTATRKTKKNSFKALEKADERAFFKKNSVSEFPFTSDLEMEFWAAVELRMPEVKVPELYPEVRKSLVREVYA